VVDTHKTKVFEAYFEKLNKYFSISAIATKPDCFATIFQDISEHKKKEEEIKKLLETSEHSRIDLLSILEDQLLDQKALQESEEKFRKAFDTNPDSITISRYVDGKYVSVNNGFTQILGYSKEDILGKSSLEINMWQMPEERKYFTLKLKTDGVVENFEAKFNTKFGKTIDCLVSAILIDLKGVTHILNNTRDISDRKQSELAISNSETRYRMLFESAKDGILILDSETGKILDVNPSLMELLGCTENKFLDKKIWEIDFFKDAVPNIEKFNVLQLNEYIGFENLTIETANGKNIHVEFLSSVYLVHNKKVIQCNIRDITDRKKAEEEISNQLDELRRWYEVTLGRESRIIDLKTEVNELLKRIGEPLRYESPLFDNTIEEQNRKKQI
jgi:PAS domain S-box-containing protein